MSVYGFGSAYSGAKGARDIDLLLLHESIDRNSCQLAIACKRGLSKRVPEADITMLSAAEEKHLRFLETASAVHIGTLRADQLEDDLRILVTTIQAVVEGSR